MCPDVHPRHDGGTTIGRVDAWHYGHFADLGVVGLLTDVIDKAAIERAPGQSMSGICAPR